MSRSVIVDDNDSGIIYSGAWFKGDSGALSSTGNFGPPMFGTLHGTNSTASLTYVFSGTEFTVIYTNQFNNPTGLNITCLIDNKSVPVALASSPTNNLVLCTKDGLTDAEHTFILKAVVTNGETFWFDYLAFVPSTSVPLNNVPLSIGQDDEQLQSGMSKGWKIFSPGFETTQTGAQFTFSFTGVSLSYYGFYDPNLPWDTSLKTAEYSVDGGSPISFNTQTDIASNAHKPATARYNQPLFETDDLPNTNHTLEVTYQGTNTSTPLTLEFLLVNSSPRNVAGSTTAVTPSNPLSLNAPKATNSTPSTPSGSPKNAKHLGAIVGAVSGGVAVFVILMVMFISLRKRQNQGYQRPTFALALDMAEPFHPVSNQNRSYAHLSGATSANTTNTVTPLVVPFPAPDPFSDGIYSSADVSHLQTPPSAQPYGMPAVELTPKGRIIRNSPLDNRKGRDPMRVATTVVQDEGSGISPAQSSGQGPVEIPPPSYSEN